MATKPAPKKINRSSSGPKRMTADQKMNITKILDAKKKAIIQKFGAEGPKRSVSTKASMISSMKKTDPTFSAARSAIAKKMGAEGPKGNSVKKVNRPSGTIKRLGKPMMKNIKKK